MKLQIMIKYIKLSMDKSVKLNLIHQVIELS